ncbi:hypothetical protein TELCIR_19272, partial [Teladorsagia circumcincta]
APSSIYYIPNLFTPEEEEVITACIVNAPQPKWTYVPGQGIMPHTDGPAFFQLVSNVTMGSHTLLDLYRPVNQE